MPVLLPAISTGVAFPLSRTRVASGAAAVS
jgi:hypothetical protein